MDSIHISGNKEQLYVEALEEGIKLYKERIRELEHEEPAVAIRRYIENHLEYTVSRKQSISLQFKDYDLEFAKPFRTVFFRFQKDFLAGIIRRGTERGYSGRQTARMQPSSSSAC